MSLSSFQLDYMQRRSDGGQPFNRELAEDEEGSFSAEKEKGTPATKSGDDTVFNSVECAEREHTI